jgi:membrane protease YdiL (CAAX protease family)
MQRSPIEAAFFALIALGLLLWIVALIRGRALEWFTGRSQLPEWHIGSSEFLAFVAALLVAMYAGPYLIAHLFGLDWRARPLAAGTAMAIGYAAQVSWLLVCVLFHLPRALRPPAGSMRWPAALVTGVTGALLFFPAVAAVDRVWRFLMPYLDLEPGLQDSVRYLRNVDGVVEFLGWATLVLVLAPVVEEWVFRRIIYRFMAARLPDAAAIVVSAVIFAIPHGNAGSFLPLVALGIALCLAYRYTGRLVTPIAMHVVFNLNTLVYVVLSPES